ncbi:MAG: hypothetical protein IT366_08695 [Candidatus Hydrogenedentes bacterium]|nr:hypothetical protein [Candidatus Hydrogenedentota bacterium]
MSTNAPSFNDVLQVVERLSLEEQEIDIVRLRVAEVNLQQLIDRVKEADEEYKAGKYSPATAEEIMREILE